MSIKFKTPASQLLLILTFFLVGNEVIAQDAYLNEAYSNGRYYFTNGQYQSVFSALQPNMDSMSNDANFDYYKRNQDGIGMVFRVYKMIIESEYSMNQIERAEYFEGYVINYFIGIFTPEEVFDYLDYAQL